MVVIGKEHTIMWLPQHVSPNELIHDIISHWTWLQYEPLAQESHLWDFIVKHIVIT